MSCEELASAGACKSSKDEFMVKFLCPKSCGICEVSVATSTDAPSSSIKLSTSATSTVTVTTPSSINRLPGSPSNSSDPVLGGVVAGALGAVLLLAIVLLLIRHRRRSALPIDGLELSSMTDSTENKDGAAGSGGRGAVNSHDGAIILTKLSDGSVVQRCAVCHTRIEWCTCGKQARSTNAHRPLSAVGPYQSGGVTKVQNSDPAEAHKVPGVSKLDSMPLYPPDPQELPSRESDRLAAESARPAPDRLHEVSIPAPEFTLSVYGETRL